MTRLAVIGAGFIGRALAVEATRRGWSVDVIGRSDPFDLARTSLTPKRLRFLSGDGVELLPKVLEHQVDALIIAAGGHFPATSVNAPAADAIGTLSLVIGLCEIIRSHSPTTRVVWLSSAGGVYPPGRELKSESSPMEPTSPYGMSRRMAEEYLTYYRRAHNLSTHSLRCANIYGQLLPRSRGQSVISAAFWSALTRTPFTLYGDGLQARDFIHIDDFTRSTLDIVSLDRPLPPALNIGTGTAYSVLEMLDAVSMATGAAISKTAGPTGATDTGTLAVDPSLLKSLVSFAPLDLHRGISRMARTISTEQGRWHAPPDAVEVHTQSPSEVTA